MLAIKVPLQDAQKIKESLIEEGALSSQFRVKKEGMFIYFPLSKRISLKKQKRQAKHTIVDTQFDPIPERKGLKDRLSSVLSPVQMQRLKTSSDLIGNIAIIELDAEFDEKKKEIAEEFLAQNKNITTVLRKQGGHEGELRIQKYEWLAGQKTTIARHKENGTIITLDVQEVYYSPRSATERLRIAHLVRPGERVLVMFSGCAPFPCVIAANANPKEIVGIELNAAGHRFGLENVKINKLKNVHLIQGDVRMEVPKLMTSHNITAFDRIVMPLPRTAEDFLNIALSAAKKGTIIHLYSFQKEGEFEKASDLIKAACKKAKRKCRILQIVKAGQSSPRTFRICVDAEILS